MVKNSCTNARDIRGVGSISGQEDPLEFSSCCDVYCDFSTHWNSPF